MKKLHPSVWAGIMSGASTKAQGARNCYIFLREGLASKKFSPEQVGIHGLVYGLGLCSPFDPITNAIKSVGAHQRTIEPEHYNEQAIFSESNVGVMSDAFHVMLNTLIDDALMAGYNGTGSFIADKLVTTRNIPRPGITISGLTHIGGGSEVGENEPYPETDFTEKWVTTKERKFGNMISITEELAFADDTGEILNRARLIGDSLRQQEEKFIVRQVTDVDYATDPAYRPSGVGGQLFKTDGSYYNYIGSGNTTSGSPFNAASALEDWTDIQHILHYRATQPKDDRIDGTPQPIDGLNGPDNILLVPWALYGTALSIVGAIEDTDDKVTTGSDRRQATYRNPATGFVREVVTSVHLTDTANYFYGNPKRQFVKTVLWPLQTFSQGADSESAFERDVVFRYKARHRYGVTCLDTPWFTMIDGA